ncbi:MAG: hypothetical protein RL641_443 [Candidatus Parcubacteria bacterium]|jgi:predicted mannosyl-3-phosphoglycerate phosphatase (HAD superfamily)
MKENIVAQLKDALGILKDYPGINDTIDIGAAEKFCITLSKSTLALIPDFKEISETEVQQFIKENQNSLDEWLDALNALKGVGAHTDRDDDDYVITGGVPKDLAALTSGTDSGELYFSFKTKNRAEFEDKAGTWAEIYVEIVKHVNENLSIPALPTT